VAAAVFSKNTIAAGIQGARSARVRPAVRGPSHGHTLTRSRTPMEMVNMQLLALLALSGGASTDVVSWLLPEHYFKAHQIDVTAAKMVELAGKDPADAKTSIAQLLAIRWLGEHPGEVKKAAAARDLLQQIAQGKKAQDPQGFAREAAA